MTQSANIVRESKAPVSCYHLFLERFRTTVMLVGAISTFSFVASAQQVSFDRDIRPIMSDTCFRCHGPDASSRMANMRLDLREEALKPKKHGTPIVPGDPEHSEIVQRIFAKDGHVMPPPFAHKELTEKQKETIRKWVAQGANYEMHWSYASVTRPPVPLINGVAKPNPIDAFVQAHLAEEGLRPSAEADRRTLIRRVTLDLTGLAPTPEETAAFVSNNSPDAYTKLVDRYSPHQRTGKSRLFGGSTRFGTPIRRDITAMVPTRLGLTVITFSSRFGTTNRLMFLRGSNSLAI